MIIAVGIEQSVEWLHHRHQRAELREALHVDAEKAIADCERVHHFAVDESAALGARIGQVQAAIKTHQPLAAAAAHTAQDWDEPIAPAWKAALSSQLVHVLPQDEIQAFWEVDAEVDTLQSLHWPMNNARQRVLEIESKDGFVGNAPVAATPAQLDEYLDALVKARSEVERFDSWAGGLRGAEGAILRGEHDLDKVQAAERQPW
ncbi:hypothetical protein ACFQBQ_02525 [Granulicella cerasi]|uniref:Uncharacterized protein n=1 Tax=Granulicella cerasi TaxID=741063 RepID=A0ABW1Z7U4_9BACT